MPKSLGKSSTMSAGICRLCLQTAELCDSHALPNSLFNYILRKNDGKAIVITDDSTTPVQYSSDTWETKLLCATCEANFNRQYDAYGIAVFRGYEGVIHKDTSGVSLLRIDCRRLRMFFLSLLWRISVSRHASYANVSLPAEWEEDLRLALLAGRVIPSSRYNVAVFRLRDSTKVGGFTPETLRGFITAPFPRRSKELGVVSVCYAFFGFFVETFLPRLPPAMSRYRGVLKPGPVHMAPYVEILEVPEIMWLLVRGLEKHEQGKTRVA